MVSLTPGVPIRFSQVSSEVLVILSDVSMDLLFLTRCRLSQCLHTDEEAR